jgi:hypothetical protein
MPEPEARMASETAGEDDAIGGPEQSGETEQDEAQPEVLSMHRRLIRATLPRIEGEQPPPRPIPEFTMHQRQTRGGQGFRSGQGWQGNGQGRGDGRQGRSGQGNSNGNSSGNGNAKGRGRGRSGRNRGHNKRSR